jgi:hypothetical protein
MFDGEKSMKTCGEVRRSSCLFFGSSGWTGSNWTQVQANGNHQKNGYFHFCLGFFFSVVLMKTLSQNFPSLFISIPGFYYLIALSDKNMNIIFMTFFNLIRFEWCLLASLLCDVISFKVSCFGKWVNCISLKWLIGCEKV